MTVRDILSVCPVAGQNSTIFFFNEHFGEYLWKRLEFSFYSKRISEKLSELIPCPLEIVLEFGARDEKSGCCPPQNTLPSLTCLSAKEDVSNI